MPESTQNTNKLIIRSEVLAVIRQMTSMGDPPRQERLKQLKRLQELDNREHVQDVLVKELQRCKSPELMQILTEFLMDLGNIDYLQDKLWGLIRDPKTSDEVKDASNLVLRHLGDTTDPDLYLEYLSDPQGLIGRETIRMLEISSENPEALIDFIDFILSLNLEDQQRLLGSLQRDYPSEYLVNIYVPLLEADPSPELWELLVTNLGETKSTQAAECLFRLSQWPEDRLPVPSKLITKALIQLQLSGAYNPNEEKVPEDTSKTVHPLVDNTTPYQCFATVSDGIGNQGMLFSRQRSNGDITMMSIALNDVHGIIDCFGFFQLSVGDFHKISEKFHEGATKIKVTPEYCAHKLLRAEAQNYRQAFRLPYEYRCWRPLLEGLNPEAPQEMGQYQEWVRLDWFAETDNLYQHPDFVSWFLEQGDEPVVTRALQKVIIHTEDALQGPDLELETYFQKMEEIADNLVLELLATDWRDLIKNRLIEAAYLLHCQNTRTFRNLAATEAFKLHTVKEPEEAITGFCRAYGRHCVAEELLRLRMASTSYEQLSPLVDDLLDRWKL